jgi:rRNA maturation endonuclease Nob1
MQDSEVHSLILEQLEEIEDERLQQFLDSVLRHEREIIDEPNEGYKDKYISLVNERVRDEAGKDGDHG